MLLDLPRGLSSRQVNFSFLLLVCFCFVSFPDDMLRFNTFCTLPEFLPCFCLQFSVFSSSFFLYGVPVKCSDDSAARFLTRGFSHFGKGDTFRIASIDDPASCSDTSPADWLGTAPAGWLDIDPAGCSDTSPADWLDVDPAGCSDTSPADWLDIDPAGCSDTSPADWLDTAPAGYSDLEN